MYGLPTVPASWLSLWIDIVLQLKDIDLCSCMSREEILFLPNLGFEIVIHSQIRCLQTGS